MKKKDPVSKKNEGATMSEADTYVDRREHPRFAKKISVQVKHISHDVSGSLKPVAPGKDIGLGGICFFSPNPYEKGEELDLIIRIDNSGDSSRGQSIWLTISSIPYAAKGEVVRCLEVPGDGGYYEVGIRFTEISEDDLRALTKCLDC